MAADLEYLIALKLDSKGVVTGARAVDGSLAALGKRGGQVSDVLGALKRQIIGLAAGYAGAQIFADAARSAVDYQDKLTRIVTLVGIHRDQVQAWGRDLRELRVGRGPAELADALYNVTSAGLKGGAALDVVKLAAKGSALGMGESNTIAKLLTAAMLAYGPAALSAADASDTLIGIIREGAADPAELAGSLGRVLGIAAQLGVSFQEAGAFVATFTRLGVDANEAVTALRGVLTTMLGPTKDQREALASVGMTMADLRREVTERGLAQALVDLVAKFKGNDDALAAIVPNVRALAGVLGTAGAQGGEFVKVAASIKAGVGGLTEEMFRLQQATPRGIFDQLKADWESAKLTFGEGLLEGLTGGAKDLSTWLNDNRATIAAWGREVGEALGTVGRGVKTLADNIDLLVAAVEVLLLLKVVGWLRAAAVATDLWAFATIPLGKGSAELFRIWAGMVRINISAWAATSAFQLGLVGAAAAAVGLAVNEMLKEWKRLSAQATQFEVDLSKIQGAGFAVAQEIRRALAEKGNSGALISRDLYDRAASAAEALRRKIAELEAQKTKFEATLKRGGFLGLKLTQREFDEATTGVEKNRLEIDRLTETLGGLEAQLGKVGAVYDEVAVAAKDSPPPIPPEVNETLDAWIKKTTAAIATQNFLAKAVGEGEEALIRARMTVDLYNEALASGAKNAVEFAQAVALAIKARIAANNKILAEGAAELDRQIREALEASLSASTTGQELGVEIPVSLVLDGPAIDKLTAEAQRVAVDLSEVWRGFVQGMQSSFQEGIRAGLGALLSGFESAGKKARDIFKDLWKGFVDMALDAIAAVVAKWAVTKLLTGDNGGSGSQKPGVGDVAGDAAKAAAPTMATWGAGAWAAVGAAVAFYAIVALDAAAKRHQYNSATTFSISGGESAMDGFFNNANRAIVSAWEGTVDAIESLTGGVITDLAEIGVKVRRDGAGVRVYVAGQFYGFFQDVQEALEQGMLAALATSNIAGVATEIEQVLGHQFRSIEELMSGLAIVQEQLDFDLSPFARGIREFLDAQAAAFDSFRSMGVDTGVVLENTIEGMRRFADELQGIEQDKQAQQLADLEAYNSERAKLEAKLQADLAAAQQQLNQAMQAQARLAGEISGMLPGAIAKWQALVDQIPGLKAVIDAILGSLATLPPALTPADLGKLGGGKGGGKKADRATLRDALDAFDLSLLSDVQQAIAAVNATQAEHAKLAHGDAELLARVNAQRARELELLGQSIRDRVSPFLASGSPWEQQAAEISAWGQQVRDDVAALAAETGTAAVETWEIVMAEALRMRELVEDAIGSLGLPLEETRRQFETLGETIDFLKNQFVAGEISGVRFAQVMAQLAQQQFLALGDGLMGFLDRYYQGVAGFEDFRQQLEAARFQIELANLRLQFELLKGLGLLTQEVIDQIQGVFDWIDEHPPNFGEPPTPSAGSGGGFGGFDAGAGSVQSAADRARELLDRYILDGMDPLRRAIYQLDQDFAIIRAGLGNTAEVQAQYAAALERIMRQHLEPIAQLQRDLILGADSPLAPRERMDQARGAFEDAVNRFRAGDMSVISEVPQIVQQFLAAARDYFPQGSEGYAAIFRMVNSFLNEVLRVGNIAGLDTPPGFGDTRADDLGAGLPLDLPAGGGGAPAAALGDGQAVGVLRESKGELVRVNRHLAEAVAELKAANRQRGRGRFGRAVA